MHSSADNTPDEASIVGLVAGGHACAWSDAGHAYCWGSNGVGQLGSGSREVRVGAVQVVGAPDVVAVGTGLAFSCALKTSGRVFCWGNNHDGQLGDATGMSQNWPTEVAGLKDAVSLAVAERFACARRRSGAVVCWGRLPTRERHLSPAAVADGVAADEVVGGSDHMCIRQGAEVSCWGSSHLGQLGDGTHCPTVFPGPACPQDLKRRRRVLGISATSLSAGSNHTCALLTDGQVACWGDTTTGQTGARQGDATAVDHLMVVPDPHVVSGLHGVDEISAGGNHTCARRGGDVLCWGAIRWESPDGPTAQRQVSPEPRPVPRLHDAVRLASGRGFSCALRAGGDVFCWGTNYSKGLGVDNPPTVASPPVHVRGVSDAVDIIAGRVSCAVRGSGEVVCWGHGRQGWSPEHEAGLEGVTDLEGGDRGICARLQDGSTVCQTYDDAVPYAPIQGAGRADALGVGMRGGCVLTEQGEVRCWEFGLDAATAAVAPAWQPSHRFEQLSVATYGGCGVDSDGSVACWGHVGGRQLGAQPVPIEGLPPVTRLAITFDHACAAVRGGEVYCWGESEENRLGNGHTARGTTVVRPVQVRGISGAVHIDAARNHTCAVLDTGGVVCWGAGMPALLGEPVPDTTNGVVEVPGVDSAVQVACGWSHCCVRRRGGGMQCWGRPYGGDLGDGVFRPVPAIWQATVPGLPSGAP
ncbi:MAG: hypothetical protein JRH11_10970 [Deltaproteobacteria bacterium]|nr:hypothetical protein [Deltaproteobacteria bacterium]